MTRRSRDELIDVIRGGDPSKLGVQLGLACIEGDVPFRVPSLLLNCAPNSVYRWFGGGAVTQAYRAPVLKVINAIRAATEAGELPAGRSIHNCLKAIVKHQGKKPMQMSLPLEAGDDPR